MYTIFHSLQLVSRPWHYTTTTLTMSELTMTEPQFEPVVTATDRFFEVRFGFWWAYHKRKPVTVPVCPFWAKKPNLTRLLNTNHHCWNSPKTLKSSTHVRIPCVETHPTSPVVHSSQGLSFDSDLDCDLDLTSTWWEGPLELGKVSGSLETSLGVVRLMLGYGKHTKTSMMFECGKHTATLMHGGLRPNHLLSWLLVD